SALRTALAEVGREYGTGLFADIQDGDTVRVMDPTRRVVYDIAVTETPAADPVIDTLEMSPSERLALVKELRAEQDEYIAELGLAMTPRDGTPRIVDQTRSPSGPLPAVPVAPELDERVIELVLQEIAWA